jgi:hypothetical protein
MLLRPPLTVAAAHANGSAKHVIGIVRLQRVHQRLDRHRRLVGSAAALLREPLEGRQLRDRVVDTLCPAGKRGIAQGLGNRFDLAGVEPLEDLILQLALDGVARIRPR